MSTRFLSPFLTPKVLSFQILVEIVCAAALLLSLKMKRTDCGVGEWLFRTRSPLLWASALYLAYSLAGAAAGVDLNRSLWGVVERQDGLVLQFHLWAWAIVTAWFCDLGFPTPDARRNPPVPSIQRLLRWLEISFWVSALAAAAVIYQWLEQQLGLFGLVPRQVKQMFEGRPGGLFGSPIFAGNYLLFHFFLGAYLLSSALKTASSIKKQRTRLKRINVKAKIALLIVAEFLLLYALLLGQVRGVLLGLAAGGFVAVALLAFSHGINRPVRVAAAAMSIFFVAASVLTWQFRHTPFVQRIPFMTRLAQTSSGELSVSSRLMAWGSAVSSFEERPIIGWGENNVYYGLNQHFNPALVQFDPNLSDGARTWYDKCHNVYLDLICEKGIVGAVLFLIIILLTARSMLRVKDRHLAIALAGGLIAHLVAIFFAFNTFGSLFALFLFFPILLLSERSTQTLERSSRETLSRGGSKATRWLHTVRGPAIAGLVLLLAASVYINLQMAVASLEYASARAAFAADPEAGFRTYLRAFESHSPYCDTEKLNCAALTIQNVINKKLTYDPDAAVRSAYQLAQDAARGLPNDAAVFMALTDMCNNLGIYNNPAYLKEAERFGRKALELSPRRQEITFYLGRTYVLTGNAARAVELNKRAVADYPDFALAHWFLGLSLIAEGKSSDARQAIRKAVDLGYRFRTAAEADAVKALFRDEFDELVKIM